MTSQHYSTSVLIVGAGPSGLTLALALLQQGIAVRIIDQDPPRPLEEGRATGTHARTLEVWERLGALAPMLEQGRVLAGFNLHAAGRLLVHIPSGVPGVPYPFSLILTQSHIERILLEQLAAQGIAVERPLALQSFTQNEHGVTALLRHADGRDEIVCAAYLLACDGGRSTVRKQLGLDFPGVQLQGAYVMDAPLEWVGTPPANGAHFFMRRTSLIGFGQLPQPHLWRIVAMLPHDDGRVAPQAPTAALIQQIADEHPDVRVRIGDPVWASSFHISNRLVTRYRHGRVFLIGDAAHIHSPFTGQGMNTGVQDAFNLAWKLALRLRGLASEALLDSYEAERRPVARRVLADTELMQRLFLLRHPLAERLRNLLIPLVLRLPGVLPFARRWFEEYTVHYRRSPVVAQQLPTRLGGYGVPALRSAWAFWRGPHAGDLAPDAGGLVMHDAPSVGGQQRLYELLAADVRHHVLVFSGYGASQERVAELARLAANLEAVYPQLLRVQLILPEDGGKGVAGWRDVYGTLHRRYGAVCACLYLIRPDGYIAFRSQRAQAAPPHATSSTCWGTCRVRLLRLPGARSKKRYNKRRDEQAEGALANDHRHAHPYRSPCLAGPRRPRRAAARHTPARAVRRRPRPQRAIRRRGRRPVPRLL